MEQPSSLWTYETVGVIADALPESEREQFAVLLTVLARPTDPQRQAERMNGVRRWLHDAGWDTRG